MSEITSIPVLGFSKGDIAPKVLVCGDPDRAKRICQKLEKVEQVAQVREYWTYNGTYKGVPVTVASHGVGAAGAIIQFFGIMMAGATHVIRVGTAGGYNGVPNFSQVIATAAVREDGLTDRYIPPTFPLLADMEITSTLKAQAELLGVESLCGVVVSDSAFYAGPIGDNTLSHVKMGALAVEMEVASLLAAAHLKGVKAGAILTIDGSGLDEAENYAPDPKLKKEGVDNGLLTALETLTVL